MSVYNTLINSLGLPITILETGMFCFATCIHPPGAAHRSTHTRDFCRNSNLRFNCISLKAARDLNPEIMKSYLTVVNRIIVMYVSNYSFPVTTHEDSEGNRMLRFHPYFDIRHNQDGRFVSSTCRPHFTPKEIPWYPFLFEGEWTPRSDHNLQYLHSWLQNVTYLSPLLVDSICLYVVFQVSFSPFCKRNAHFKQQHQIKHTCPQVTLSNTLFPSSTVICCRAPISHVVTEYVPRQHGLELDQRQ